MEFQPPSRKGLIMPSADANAPHRPRVRLGYRLAQLFIQIFFVFFFRTRAFGARRVPVDGGVLLICNHQSYFDPVLAALPLPRECSFMARDTLFAQPHFRRLISYLNAFPVRRATADMAAMREAIRRLRDGLAVVVFPEGTRTRDGSIGEFHLGSMLLAKRAGAPIVPVVVVGAFESWPRDRKLPRPAKIAIHYGEVVTSEQVREWSEERLAEVVRGRMVAMYEAAHAPQRR